MRSAFHLHVLYSRIEGVTLRKECKIVIFRLVLPIWQYHWPQYLDVTKLAKAKLKCFLNCSMFVSNYKMQESFHIRKCIVGCILNSVGFIITRELIAC
jgi:hypothetical protein